jgi:hypothetical protein
MRNVRAEVEVQTTVDRAIAAFLDSRALGAWWGVERALVEKKVGGVFAIAWAIAENGFGYLTTGTIGALAEGHLRIDHYTYFHPQRSILGPMTLSVEARPRASGVLLSVTQAGYQTGSDWDWYYDAVHGAWPRVVKDVARYLEGESSACVDSC